MSTDLHIGKVGRSRFTLPLEIATQATAIHGVRGKGKTVTASVIVEELLEAGVQTVVIDPTDTWFGLKSSADGKKDGFPVVIFGGTHGDLPLDAGSGAVIADLAVERRLPMILSLRHLRKGQQRRFVTDFAEQLYHRKGEPEHRTPLFLAIDEASQFCLTADTEILTQKGWRTHDTLGRGDRVVAYNPETDRCAVEAITHVIRREHSGTMVHLKTLSLDCLVTPDHRVVLRRQQRAKGRFRYYPWTFCTASDVPTSVQVPAARPVYGPGVPGLSVELARIIGWVLTDGFLHHAARSDILAMEQATSTVKAGRRIAEEMDALLAARGASRSVRATRETMIEGRRTRSAEAYLWYFRQALSDEIYGFLPRPLAPKVERRVPRALVEGCDQRQLESLFLGLMEGDGTSEGDGWVFQPGHSQGLADDVQEIGTRLGKRTLKNFVRQNGQWRVAVREIQDHWVRAPGDGEYSGTVWDVTVPSGAFVARRNGRVFITGNCPQKVMGDSARMVGAIQDIVRMGRSAGLGVALIDQRPATVNKDVLTQIELMVCHAVTSPQDRKALDEWVKQKDSSGRREEFLEHLASLPRGEAWFWMPIGDLFKRVRVRMRSTFDSSKTPELGEAAVAPEKLAEVDLAALRSALEETIAQVEANDPKVLQKRIRELEAEIGRTPEAGPDPEDIAAEIREAVDVEVAAALKHMRGRFAAAIARVAVHVNAAHAAADEAAGAVLELDDMTADEELDLEAMDAAERPARVPTAAPKAPRRPAAAPAPPAPPERPVEDLSAPQQRILDALAAFEALGLHEADRSVVAVFSDQSPTSSGYANNLGALRNQHGLIDYPSGGMVRLTEAGRAAARNGGRPATLRDLHERWKEKLSGPQARIVDVLVGIYPDSIGREELAQETDQSPTSSGYANNLGRMRSLGVVEYPQRGRVAATTLLFPTGLR